MEKSFLNIPKKFSRKYLEKENTELKATIEKLRTELKESIDNRDSILEKNIRLEDREEDHHKTQAELQRLKNFNLLRFAVFKVFKR